jgi:hypothetical protein
MKGTTGIVEELRTLVEEHYVFPDVAAEISARLADGLARGRYPADEASLAGAVTLDLQSINGDKHLRLLHRAEAMAPRPPGDDSEEYAAMARWAARTCGGVTAVDRLAGNVGHLDLRPVLFPSAIAADAITCAMTLLADTDAILVDLRHCLGGEPTMVAFLISYLWDHEPAQLTGLQSRTALRQSWTLPHVPGRRPGKTPPVYVLTSATTFSGAEELAYDLRQLGRATIVGEPTRGGAHAREGFVVRPHLEATIPVAFSVDPTTGGNWEGTGIIPDVATSAWLARDRAYQLALAHVIDRDLPAAAEAHDALAELSARLPAGDQSSSRSAQSTPFMPR